MENINFDFPKVEETVVATEVKIKTYLRKYGINITEEKEIERYSDKYSESTLTNIEKVKNYLYPELMSPEICDYFRFNLKSEIDEIEKSNISDFELSSENELNNSESAEEGDYKIHGEDNEDSETSNNEFEDVI